MGANGYDLFWMLARTEFRMRDQGTFLGFLWSLLLPLFQFAILYAIFTRWMGGRIENYAAYLLIGIVQWNLFSAGTTHGLTSLRRKAGLVSNFNFPSVFVPLSSTVAVLASHVFEWIVLFCALFALGIEPRWSWLLLPVPVAFAFLLTVGVACVLAFAAVRIRDLDHVWSVFLYGLFFATPIFYSPDIVGGVGKILLTWNPLSILIGATRALVMGGSAPSPTAIVATALFSITIAGAGIILSPRRGGDVAEVL